MTFIDATTPCPACSCQIPLRDATCPKCRAPMPVPADFTPFTRPDGSGGIVDAMTLTFLRSAAPEPTQVALDAILARTTRAHILRRKAGADRTLRFHTVAALDTPGDLRELAQALRIKPFDGPGGHLMTFGEFGLTLFADEEEIATLEVLSYVAIRWEGVWRSDAPFADPESLAAFFARRGIPEIGHAMARDEARARQYERDYERWSAATPACFRQIEFDLNTVPFAQSLPPAAVAALAAAYPDPVARATALLTWYGSGAGPWSGYPAYENIPDIALAALPIETVIAASSAPDAPPELLTGAARFFSTWTKDKRRKANGASVPPALRARLLAHMESIGAPDIAALARRALA